MLELVNTVHERHIAVPHYPPGIKRRRLEVRLARRVSTAPIRRARCTGVPLRRVLRRVYLHRRRRLPELVVNHRRRARQRVPDDPPRHARAAVLVRLHRYRRLLVRRHGHHHLAHVVDLAHDALRLP